MSVPICPFCGKRLQRDEAGESLPCKRETCVDASSRVMLPVVTYAGARCNWPGQNEAERVRKRYTYRLLPEAGERIRARARREGIAIADLLERWALSEC